MKTLAPIGAISGYVSDQRWIPRRRHFFWVLPCAGPLLHFSPQGAQQCSATCVNPFCRLQPPRPSSLVDAVSLLPGIWSGSDRFLAEHSRTTATDRRAPRITDCLLRLDTNFHRREKKKKHLHIYTENTLPSKNYITVQTTTNLFTCQPTRNKDGRIEVRPGSRVFRVLG